MRQQSRIIAILVSSQFMCTSLWFAGNVILEDLSLTYNLEEGALSHLVSAVQLGFIIGTLIYAIYTIADRYSPSKVFLVSALFAALANMGITILSDFNMILVLRFLTGFFLAGIYPVGMKIASDYFKDGLGKALGFLVGALVLGTASPHLIKEIISISDWQWVIYWTSFLAVLGGTIVGYFIPDGPFRKAMPSIHLGALFFVFKSSGFRKAAIGYFGHMWELYAFWAYIPIMIHSYNITHNTNIPVSISSFSIIGIGFFSCILGGYLSDKVGSKMVALCALFISMFCCLMANVAFSFSPSLFIGFLFIWSFFVIADSPQFSTLVAHSAPPSNKGTALTIVNCIGFAITIISIEIMGYLLSSHDIRHILYILFIGPLIGLFALSRNGRNHKDS